jgi:hypothetical protein
MFSILSDNARASDLKNAVENSRQTRPFEIVQYARLENLVVEPGYKGITILRDSYFFPQFNTNPLQPGDRILLYGQDDPIQNGVWNVMSLFAGYVNIQRPSDYNKNTLIRPGQYVLAFLVDYISKFSGSISASNNILTVSGPVTGHPIVLDMVLSGTNITTGTKITGVGNNQTYTISPAPTLNVNTTIKGTLDVKSPVIFKNTTVEYDSNQNKINSYNGTSPQYWEFYRYIVSPIALSKAKNVKVMSGLNHFTETTYDALTDNNLIRPTSKWLYRLHGGAIIGWGLNDNFTGGSVQVWWSNNDGIYYEDIGIIVEVGSYNNGTTIINYTTTIMGAPIATNYTPSNITIPSNITWNYLQLRSVSFNNPYVDEDPILWEVRINNVPN